MITAKEWLTKITATWLKDYRLDTTNQLFLQAYKRLYNKLPEKNKEGEYIYDEGTLKELALNALIFHVFTNI